MSNDPFAGLAQTDSSAEDIVNDAFSGDFEFDFDAAFEITDATYEVTTGGGFTPYVLPAENTLIPVRIVKAKVEDRETRIVVARTRDGKVLLDPTAIDEAVKSGQATEEIVTTKVPRFNMEVEHVADIYGTRRNDFFLNANVYAVKISYTKNGKDRSFNTYSGPKLFAATHVLGPGEKPNRAKLQELADAMHGKIVMARVYHTPKPYQTSTDRLDENGKVIKAMVDEHGSFVKVIKDGDSYFYEERDSDGNLTPYDMEEQKLVEFKDGYVIRDFTSEGAPVKDLTETIRTYDNLRDDVFPVPAMDPKTGEGERLLTFTRTNGTDAVTGTVTWNTISQIVKRPVAPGTMAQVVLDGGELVTVNWMGTGWMETPEPYAVQLSEDGKLQFVTAEGGLNTFSG